jgi:UDP-N-acetyl-D-glucosamine dehydrogenase
MRARGNCQGGALVTTVASALGSRPEAVTEPDLLVIGLGYVGLPLAAEAVRSGLTVTGFDVSDSVAAGLMAGHSHVADVSPGEVALMVASGFLATADEAAIGSPATIVICVPTPLRPDLGPDLTAVRAAAQLAARLLRPGTLVVLESTTYPGTTEDVLRPVLEAGSGLVAGRDFAVAFSPERIDPGNRDFGIRNTPKVVGGLTPECTDAAVVFYGKLCDQVVRAASAREAEMAKLLENTYRHVNIALMNEMAVFCHELQVDLWDAIRCAGTKPFGFQAFYPGPGVGGHCIPIDPNYLSYKVRTLGYPFRFVELAQEINARMPAYVVDRVSELLNRHAKPLNGASVLLLGITYKKDSADMRESPAVAVARRLRARGARLSYHDPLATDWQVDGADIPRAADVEAAVDDADLVLLLQAHSAFDLGDIERRARLLFDTRGVVTAGERL